MLSRGTYVAAAEHAEGDFVAVSLDRRELLRVRGAVSSAERLLGREPGEAEPSPEVVAELIVALEADLGDRQTEADTADGAAHKQQLERLGARFGRRREAFARLESGVERLREMTSPPAILDVAPRRLGESSDFDRVLLSTIEGGRMIAVAADFDGDPDGAAAALQLLAEQPIALEHPLLEAEMLRRRRATAVPDTSLSPRVSPVLTEAMGWDSYVAAPVVIMGRAIAVLHADRRDGGLDVLHRDVLWRFAVGLGQAYESASLRRRLRREREYMRRFLDRLDARLGDLSDSAVQFAPRSTPPTARADAGHPGTAAGAAAFEGILTRREIEILALLAEGLSNRKIADRLVISEGTVKFHVNSILRKLRAANRAEAVSRYLSRTLERRP
jgi:DNA-binding CsgD family transcriptional regulator